MENKNTETKQNAGRMNDREVISRIRGFLDSKNYNYYADEEENALQFGFSVPERDDAVAYVVDTPCEGQYRVRAFLKDRKPDSEEKKRNLIAFLNELNCHMGAGYFIANSDGSVGFIHYQRVGATLGTSEIMDDIYEPMATIERFLAPLEEYMNKEPEELLPPEQAVESILNGTYGAQDVALGRLQ